MSEVDRLSNSGLYPALPVQDRRDGGADGKPPPNSRAKKSGAEAADRPDPNTPHPPKSLIDEYA
jgi:hypothetical protein